VTSADIDGGGHMKKLGKLVLVLGAGIPLLGLTSCEKDGAEEVGEDIEEAVDDAGRAIEDATD
jgi:hypothetical protein